MNEQIAKRWVAALRSGDYKQAQGELRNGDKFCCLGVLCNLHAQAHPDIAAKETNPDFYLGEIGFLPDEVRTWAGLTTTDGSLDGIAIEIGGDRYMSLDDANDRGAGFKQIADWIDSNHNRL